MIFLWAVYPIDQRVFFDNAPVWEDSQQLMSKLEKSHILHTKCRVL